MTHHAVHAGLYDLCSEPRQINYELMRREYPKLKAALTRAVNNGDPEKVLAAVERFVKVSDEVGCQPDDWPRWRNALEDAFRAFQRIAPADWDETEIASITRRFQLAATRF